MDKVKKCAACGIGVEAYRKYSNVCEKCFEKMLKEKVKE